MMAAPHSAGAVTRLCLRSISRPSLQTHSSFPPVPSFLAPAAFSTSAMLSNVTVKKNKSSVKTEPKRGERRSIAMKKKKVVERRKPAPGERRALRKRIVLSNTNALEVHGMADLNKDNTRSDGLVGKMVGLPGEVVDSLRAIESFKPTQGWGFFRRPASLMRKESQELGRFIGNSDKSVYRRIVTGERGSGKSVLLLQAHAAAFLHGWVVIHLPEASELTNAHTNYEPIPSTNPVRYSQKNYTSRLLSRIASANQKVLDKLTISLKHNLPIPLQENISLYRMAEMGAQDQEIAWPIYQALWAELTSTSGTQRRPPILFTADSLPFFTRPSEYLAPDMVHIHSFDLALVDQFISHLSGTSKLPNGGMVLAADSFSNRPSAPSLDVAIRQSELRTSTGQKELSLFDVEHPFRKVDPRVIQRLQRVDVLRLSGIDKVQARAILEYYARSGMLRQTITEGLVTEKWTLAGRGVIGELERETVRAGL